MTDLEKAAKEMLRCVDRMLRDGEWYAAQEKADALRAALAQQQGEPVVEPVVEPSYFGLTKDHTWLSVSKEQYDKLKPQGRMVCIVGSEK